jgi:hypothetical protein
MVPNVMGSSEGWELYIVTDGVMVGHVSALQNAIIRESDMNTLRWCPM